MICARQGRAVCWAPQGLAENGKESSLLAQGQQHRCWAEGRHGQELGVVSGGITASLRKEMTAEDQDGGLSQLGLQQRSCLKTPGDSSREAGR